MLAKCPSVLPIAVSDFQLLPGFRLPNCLPHLLCGDISVLFKCVWSLNGTKFGEIGFSRTWTLYIYYRRRSGVWRCLIAFMCSFCMPTTRRHGHVTREVMQLCVQFVCQHILNTVYFVSMRLTYLKVMCGCVTYSAENEKRLGLGEQSSIYKSKHYFATCQNGCSHYFESFQCSNSWWSNFWKIFPGKNWPIGTLFFEYYLLRPYSAERKLIKQTERL